MANLIKRIVPGIIQRRLKTLLSYFRRFPRPGRLKVIKQKARALLPYYRRFHCPICGAWDRRFESFRGRPDARCPMCGSLERHRFVWLFWLRQTDLFSGARAKMLHFAPEPCLASRLSQMSGLDYTTADLRRRHAMVKADITDLQFPDETFDVLYCSHVLEHVPDDRQGIRECCRVLKRTGWALILVPITARSTFEDPSITDPKERERVFGLAGHLRRYGPDFADRLREAGFVVSVYTPDDVAREDAARFSIGPKVGPLYLCRRH